MVCNRGSICLALDKIAVWALYLMIFMLPISKSFIEITIVTALVSVIVSKILKREPFKKLTPAEIAVVVVVVAAFPSLFNSCDLSLSIKALFTKVAKFAALALMVREIIDTKEKLRDFLVMASLSAAIIVVDAFVQYFITHRDLLHFDGMRYLGYPSFQFSEATLLTNKHHPYPKGFLGFPTASFPYPNDFATWIIVVVFSALAFLSRQGAALWKRVWLAILASSLVFLLILTKTRSAWLGFVAALFMLPFFKVVHIKRIGIILLVVGILVCGVVLRESLLPHIVAMAGIADRQVMWGNAWKIFMEHPLIGCGLNTFFVNYARVRQDEFSGLRGSYAHNCYLQMAADVGLIGLAAFLVMIALVMRQAMHAYTISKDAFLRAAISGLVLGMSAYLVNAFLDTNLYSLNLAALFWLSLGLIFSATSLVREEGRT